MEKLKINGSYGKMERWKADWNAVYKSKNAKVIVLELGREIYPQPESAIQKFVDEFNTDGFEVNVLFSLVANPELNPIEIW